MLSITRAALVADMEVILFRVHRSKRQAAARAEAIAQMLDRHDITYAREAGSPCPACGRPGSVEYGGSCHMGGCPLGGDL
jgi:hypothetical protein